MSTKLGIASVILIFSRSIGLAQTYWDPDSTGYNYLSRGTNLSQWVASAGTKLQMDSSSFSTGRGSIKWTIPPHSDWATLDLLLIDIDLRDRIIYTTCRRNNHPALIDASLITSPGKGFRLPAPVNFNEQGIHLTVNAWHKQGQSAWLNPFGGATRADLRHVSKFRFTARDAEIEQILWIDEIKYTRPRGPVCIIHFNQYRDSADSLLTPWLISRGYRANIDFTYDWAEKRLVNDRAGSGLKVRYIGLGRISELVNMYDWSTTHHGTFYKNLRTLSLEERLQLYSLEPFLRAGFITHWCFSIPTDLITPEIYAEIQALKLFHTVRKQFTKEANELPIDNPLVLRFYRPTSANAGPNLHGRRETLAEMKARVDAAFSQKGLIIFDFGSIVTEPSSVYTSEEITMLSDAQGLIDYADSLGFTFLTFRDLFQSDPNYKQQLSINHDYAQAASGRIKSVPVLQNDLFPVQKSLSIASISKPKHGQAVIAHNKKSVIYVSADLDFVGNDRFNYVATDGALFDTASVFVNVVKDTSVNDREILTDFILSQNCPNPFNPATTISYTLPVAKYVSLKVYNIHGQEVATIVDEFQEAGMKLAVFDVSRLAGGIYFYRLVAGSFVATRKMIAVK